MITFVSSNFNYIFSLREQKTGLSFLSVSRYWQHRTTVPRKKAKSEERGNLTKIDQWLYLIISGSIMGREPFWSMVDSRR
jgi:hypothetical protein